jgi:dipeptidyl aminopeptidase/acylaminoacyl peptidase
MATAVVAAQDVMTVEEFVDLPSLSDVRLSPAGRRVAYVVRIADRTSIWVDGHQMTHSFGSEDQPRWLDDERLAFRSDRTGRPQVYALSISGGESVRLTSESDGVLAYAPSPDGTRIAFTTYEHRPAVDPIHFAADDELEYALDEPRRSLRVTHLLDAMVETVAGSPGWIGAFAWSPSGDTLAFVRRGWPDLEGGAIPATIETTSGRTLLHLDGAPDELQWTHAGIFFQGTVRMAPRSAQCLYRLDDGARIVAGDTNCLGVGTGNGAMLCGHTPDDLTVLVAEGLTTSLLRVDPRSAETEVLFAAERGDIHSASVVRDHWAAVVSAADQPPEVYLDGRQVSSHYAAYDTSAWPRQESFFWRSADGLELDGVALVPRHIAATARPAVFVIHGGPYGSRVTQGFQHPVGSWTNWGLLLAASGMAVVLPNFRGGLGHGEAFAQPVGGREGQWADIQSCVDAAVQRGLADPERMGIGGWSYGGYLSAWAVGHTDCFKAALVGAAPVSLETQSMGADLLRYGRAAGSMPWDGVGPLPHQEWSPVAYIPRVNTPVLVMHGEADRRCPLANSLGYHRGMRELGKLAELVVYRGAPHSLTRREHRVDASRRIRDWFRRWLGS